MLPSSLDNAVTVKVNIKAAPVVETAHHDKTKIYQISKSNAQTANHKPPKNQAMNVKVVTQTLLDKTAFDFKKIKKMRNSSKFTHTRLTKLVGVVLHRKEDEKYYDVEDANNGIVVRGVDNKTMVFTTGCTMCTAYGTRSITDEGLELGIAHFNIIGSQGSNVVVDHHKSKEHDNSTILNDVTRNHELFSVISFEVPSREHSLIVDRLDAPIKVGL